MNWFPNSKPEGELQCTAKFRYRQQDNDVTIRFLDETTVYVSYPQKVSSVTCGQEAVFYLGEECLGGGVIEQTFSQGVDLNKKILKAAYLFK